MPPVATGPDFEAIGNSFATLSEQTKLLKDYRPVTLDAIQKLLQDSEKRIRDGVKKQIEDSEKRVRDDVKTQIQGVTERIDTLSNKFDLIPMQLYNAQLPLSAPLRFPPGVVFVDGMPQTKQDLGSLTVANCVVTANALGVTFSNGSAVQDRRQFIAGYLGAV